MNKMDEQIIVVPRDVLFDNENLFFQGVLSCKSQHQYVDAITYNLEKFFSIMRRGDAEENPNYKQPIPYAVIRKGDKFFVYKRLQGGGEALLHEKLSIGVGGHMNDVEQVLYESIDVNFNLILEDNLLRELNEELFISSDEQEIEILGLINDDSNKVGKVHLGILVVIDLDENAIVEVLETEQLEGQWMTHTELLEQDTYDKLENWSKIAVDEIF